MDYEKVVRDVIEEHKLSPIDMRGIGDAAGEYAYLCLQEPAYARTVRDIDSLYKNNRGGCNILEIGSFLGGVSISLKRLGYNVSALDIPEYYESNSLRQLYKQNEIPFNGVNLKHSGLPYPSETFDAVVICEVIEHLNFNPLPALMEINRVLKKGGHVYIAMPNQARIGNRAKLLLGKSIHNPVEDFFTQLDKNDNMIVGLHWREYTLPETLRIIKRMGFEISSKYYFAEKTPPGSRILRLLKKLLYVFPPFRPCQVVIAKKIATPSYDFWRTDANS